MINISSDMRIIAKRADLAC